MGLYENFRPAMGLYTEGGVIQENVYNAFLCTKRCRWDVRGQKSKIAKKIVFSFAAKNGGYAPGGYTPEGLHQAL